MTDRADAISAPARKTQIVVVGGGAAGLKLARRLGARYGRKRHDIILVDKNRTHIWKPLLHEVAAGALDANLDEIGYGGHGYRWGYRFFHGAFTGFDPITRQVHIAPLVDDDGTELVGAHSIRYDYLVLAVGSVTNDFGVTGVGENCIFLDSRSQADRFRDKLLNQCLRVSRAMSIDPATAARVRVAIVGAGATGVELAAELYNAADALQQYGLETFARERLTVSLIEAGPRILPALPYKLAAKAHAWLTELGVEIHTATAVVETTPDGMKTKDHAWIAADIQVWAAGVRGTVSSEDIGWLETSRNGQIVVRPTLQVREDDRVFAIGDCAYCVLEDREGPVPPRAQAAAQMADCVFDNLNRIMSARPLKDFVYRDKGSLVSLSRFSTVGNLMGSLLGGQLAIQGRLARMIYISLYRMHLIGVHGWFKGCSMIVVGHINQVVRPRLKLH